MNTRPNPLSILSAFTLVVVVAFLGVSIFLHSTTGGFHAQRLAPAVAMWVGWPVYPNGGFLSGAITLYPPLFPAFYLPAAMLMDGYWTPAMASALSAFYLLFPLWLLCRRLFPDLTLPMLSLAAIALLQFVGGTEYVLVKCISEAPVIFLLAMGANLLLSQHRNKALYGGILFAAAVFCKQTYLLTLVVPAIYFGLWRDWRNLWIYLASAAGTVALLGAVFVAAFGYQTLWLNLVEIPSRHPMYEASLRSRRETPFLYYVEGLAYSAFVLCWPALLATFLAVLLALLSRVAKISNWIALTKPERSAGTLLLLLCLACLVTGILGMAKVGGTLNTLAPFAYFAILYFLFVGRIVSRKFAISRKAAAALLVALSLNAIFITGKSVQSNRSLWFLQTQTTEMVRQHQGNLIFLNNPLAHLIVEQRNYPVLDVLFCFQLAGYNGTPLAKQEIAEVNPGGLGLTYNLVMEHVSVLNAMYAERPEPFSFPSIRIATFPNPDYLPAQLPLGEDPVDVETEETTATQPPQNQLPQD